MLEDCERSLDNGSVYGPTRMLQPWVFVEPENETWSVAGYSNFYLLDVAVDNPGIARFFGNQSLSSTVADFSSLGPEVPAGAARLEHWAVDAGAWNATFEFPYVQDPTPQDLTRKGSLWFGEGPFARLALERTHTADSLLTAATLVVTGASRLQTAMIAPAAPYLSDSSHGVDNFLSFDGRSYA